MNTRNIARLPAMSATAMMLVGTAGCASQDASNPKTFSNWMQDRPKRLRSARSAEPKLLPVTFFAAGKLFEKQGQLAQAACKYQQAVAANRRFVVAYNRLGIVLDRLGRFQNADDAFIRAIEVAPDKAYLRNNLAFSYILQNRLADAQTELRNALQLCENFTRARINLAVVLAKQGKFSQALHEFDKALPKADARYNLAMVLASLGRYQDAAELYRKALALNPDLAAARTQLDRLADKLARPRPDEPRAAITDDEIIDLQAKTAQAPSSESVSVEQDVEGSPAGRKAESDTPSVEIPETSGQDVGPPPPAAVPSDVQAASDMDVPPQPSEDAGDQSASSAEVQPKQAGETEQVNEPKQADQPKQADGSVQADEADQIVDVPKPMVINFEHDRPDTVGLPPARQRDVMLAMAHTVRAKLARWAAFLPHRPDRSRFAADQNRLDEPDFITSPASISSIPDLDSAGPAKKESGEDQ